MSSAESKTGDENSIGNSQLLTKPGQKFPTPSPGNGDRVFYETLLKQRPDSEMAQDWCLSYGILNSDQAAILFDKVNKRKLLKQSPGKAKSKPVVSSKRKKRADDDDDDDGEFDTGLGNGGIWEGQGTTGL